MNHHSTGLHWHGRRLLLETTAGGDARVELLSGKSVLLRVVNSSSSKVGVKLAGGDPPRALQAPVHVEVLDHMPRK